MYLIASGQFNATTCAAHIGRQDETVLGWVHRYNDHGPDALTYRRTGGRAPLLTSNRSKQIVEVVEKSRPAEHGLPGHVWTVKKLRQWLFQTFGLRRRPQHHPPRLEAGEADVEEDQEAAGQGQPGEEGRPRRGSC